MDTLDILNTDSGNANIVALDHGLGMGSIDGIEDPKKTLTFVLEGGPDGVLVGPYFAQRFSEIFSASDVEVVVTTDTFFAANGLGDYKQPIHRPPSQHYGSLEENPAGVKIMLVFGREQAAMRQNLEYVAKTAESLSGTGIPLIVETVLWGDKIPENGRTDAERLESACRVAWEHGADALKIPYTGEVESFRRIVERVPVPVFILGGPASNVPDALLADIRDAIDAGARGTIIGRSIWQTDEPPHMVRRIDEIVHDGI